MNLEITSCCLPLSAFERDLNELQFVEIAKDYENHAHTATHEGNKNINDRSLTFVFLSFINLITHCRCELPPRKHEAI